MGLKTVKMLTEEVEQLGGEAQGIYASAQSDHRDLTDDEVARFDEITNKPDGLLILKEKELAAAIKREDTIREISQKNERKSRLDELTAPGGVLNPTSNAGRALVLPHNGKLESGADQQDDRIYVRQAKLKAFANNRIAFNCGMWLRAVVAKSKGREDKAAMAHIHKLGWEITNVGIEGTGSLGGFTVPAPLSQTIIDVRESVGVMRRIAKIMPMTADTLSIARRDGGLTVYYVGEAQAITLSDKTWGQIQLIVKKRAVAHQISQELQEDALISIVDDAFNEMAYALAAKEDAEGINGDGTGTYGGVTGLRAALGSAGTSTAATGHDTWPELDIADFTAAMGLLPDKYSREPVWVCSANFYWSTMVRVQAAAAGNNIGSIEAGPGQPRFLGRPVFFTDQMPKTSAAATVCALFGTFDMGVILGERTGVSIDRSDDYAFLNDVITVKATTRYDINVHAPGDATNAGAYIGLKTAA